MTQFRMSCVCVSLGLAGNGIGSGGVKAIADVIKAKVNTTLQSLDVSPI